MTSRFKALNSKKFGSTRAEALRWTSKMLPLRWLLGVFVILLLRYSRRILYFIKKWIHIRALVNKLPGPPTIPIFGNVYNLKWDAEEFTFQMEYFFRKYAYKNDGLIRFWLGPIPVVFLTRPESVKVVLESNKLLYKPPEYALLKPIWGNGLITSSGDKWRKRRRMLTPAFHFAILNSYLTVFNKQAKIMENILDKQYCSKNLDIDFLPILRRFSMDTISETAMGMSINAQMGENNDFYQSITCIFELLFKNLRYPWLWIKPIWYSLGYGFEFDKHVTVVKRLVLKLVDKRKQEFENLAKKPTFKELSAGGNKKLAFLDLLFSMREQYNLTDEDIMEEVGTIMVAGYDTVSSSIGFVLWLLGHHHDIQDNVYDELYSIFGDDLTRNITVEDTKKMKYLEQCMKESFRMYPTVAIIGRRITEETKICGYTIPEGITIIVSPFSVARDPEQWENPETFDPDHFSPENCAKRHPFSFLPFSAGPRNCIGQKFAILEEKVALARILRRFKVISLISEEENRALPEVSLKPSKGFPMRLIERSTLLNSIF